MYKMLIFYQIQRRAFCIKKLCKNDLVIHTGNCRIERKCGRNLISTRVKKENVIKFEMYNLVNCRIMSDY